jgi:hypothetical protein
MRGPVNEAIDQNRSAFLQLLEIAATIKQKLKLVVAIDEASECPNLVRTIINNTSASVWDVALEFQDEFRGVCPSLVHQELISVQFSVACTGASASTVGSRKENFINLDTSFVLKQKDVRGRFLDALPEMVLPGLGGQRGKLRTHIQECLPVVAVMMENGRMASIACSAISEHHQFVPIVESTLVEPIALKFMCS